MSQISNSEIILLLVLCSSLLLGKVLFRVTFECDEFAHEILVDIHYSRVIVKVSTIILGAEYSHELLILAEEAIAIFHHLMSTTNEIKIMLLQELLKLLASKNVPTSSLILFPVAYLLIGIIPKQISDDTTVGDISWLRNLLDLFKAVNLPGDASVHAHYLLVNKGYQWHMIEAVVKRLPKRDFIPSFDLIEKAIHSCNSLALVVTSQDGDLLRVSNFQCK